MPWIIFSENANGCNEHITRNDVWEKLFQGDVPFLSPVLRAPLAWKVSELITVKFAIPEKKIFISAELRAVMQCCDTIFRLFALQNRCCVPHLIARIYSEPANSEITGTFSRNRPRTSIRPTKGTGVWGCRKSNGSIRTSR